MIFNSTDPASWAFLVCSLSAVVGFYCGYRGLLNTYYLGGDTDYRPSVRHTAYQLMWTAFVLGCVLTLL